MDEPHRYTWNGERNAKMMYIFIIFCQKIKP